MKLALFLPGAYIWPVHRSFEAFLASLAAPARDELQVISSSVYPATRAASTPQASMNPRLEQRLLKLHRDLYDAMLRPLDHFARSALSIDDYFWPDLKSTSTGQLMESFLFCFTHRVAAGTPVSMGLSVIRSVFFSHEQAEPEHWLHTSLKRLVHLRDNAPQQTHSFTAPPASRVQDLAFVIHSALDRPPYSTGWITGTIVRKPDGLCQVQAGWCYDPLQADAASLEQAYPQQCAEVETVIRHIFGWTGASKQEAA